MAERCYNDRMPPATSILCISGWGTDESCWRGAVAALEGVALVRHVPWWQCLAERANFLREAIAAESRPVVVVGWSLGAIVALEAALAAPGNLHGLVLVAGTAAMSDSQDLWGVEPERLRAMSLALRSRRPAVLEEFARLATARDLPEADELGAVEQLLAMSAPIDTAHLAAGLRYLAATDLRAEIGRVGAPTFVLHGDRDRVIPPTAGRMLAQSIPAARLIPIPGAGHAVPLTHPDAVARAVMEMIDAVATAR